MESPRVALVLDSSVAITGERRGHTARQILEQVKTGHGEVEIGLSVVTIAELAHGVQRAGGEDRRQRWQAFLDEPIRDVPVHPITVETAKLAGRIAGERASQGVRIAFEDLPIAATALQLCLGAATGNVRHFRAVPGLTVVQA